MALMLRGLGDFDILDPSTWGGSGGSTTPTAPTPDFTGDPNSLPLCPASMGGKITDADIAAGRVGADHGYCRNYVGGSAVKYVDPWDPTATGTTFRVQPGTMQSGGSSGVPGSGIFDWLLGAGAAGVVQATNTTPGTHVTTTMPLAKTPWYKTPIGLIGLGLAAFLGYKYFSSQSKAASPGA